MAFTAAHFASPLWSGVAAAIPVLGLTWYVGAQTMWFAGAGIGLPRAFGLAVGTILLAFLALLALAVITGLTLSASGAL